VAIIGATFWISPHLSEPVIGVALGVIIGGVLQVIFQLPWIFRSGVSLRPIWMPGHPAVKKIGMLMLPAIFGSAVYQFNQFIGTLLASLLANGSVSWLYYADRLVQFPLGIFAIAISTAALPSLSRQAAEKGLDEFKGTLTHSLRLTFFITIPSMAGLIMLGHPIIKLFFERGVFDAHSTKMTTLALIFYSVGLWAFSGIRIIVSAFYALQDTRTPVKVAVIALAANLILSLLLMGPLDHGGLALALSLASSIQFCLLVFFLKRRISAWDLGPILMSAGKSLAASAVMCGVICFLYSFQLMSVQTADILPLAFAVCSTILIGIITYFLTAYIFRCREVEYVLDMLNALLRKIAG
ncbi:MAG: murein biosynthesis integral membrane protein MurJ, partial [Deltaproteobacteria bacterium]|nr:murein biosynthesis integral membrane protein MurJ [Deltaproteobacteria bacterium]